MVLWHLYQVFQVRVHLTDLLWRFAVTCISHIFPFTHTPLNPFNCLYNLIPYLFNILHFPCYFISSLLKSPSGFSFPHLIFSTLPVHDHAVQSSLILLNHLILSLENRTGLLILVLCIVLSTNFLQIIDQFFFLLMKFLIDHWWILLSLQRVRLLSLLQRRLFLCTVWDIPRLGYRPLIIFSRGRI